MRIDLDAFQVYKITDKDLAAPVYILGLFEDVRIIFPEGGNYQQGGTKPIPVDKDGDELEKI